VSYITSLLQIVVSLYRQALVVSYQRLRLSWHFPFYVILVWSIYVIASSLLFSVIPPSWVRGIILGLLNTVMVTVVLSALETTLIETRRRASYFTSLDGSLFREVLLVQFALFFPLSFAGQMIGPQGFFLLMLIVSFVWNPIAEFLYVQRRDGMTALTESWGFIQESGVEWFIATIGGACALGLLLQLPFLFLSYQGMSPPGLGNVLQGGVISTLYNSFILTESLSVAILARPIEGILRLYYLEELFTFFGLFYALFAILCVYLSSWFILFRGTLFQVLGSSTRRSRAYRAALH
jgi:hypothetical protein